MLKIENLELIHNRDTFLRINKLELNAGDKALICGDNLSGKSYLTQTLHGLNKSYSGDIMIKGKIIILYKRRKKTLLVEHTPSVLSDQTLWKNLNLPLSGITARQKQKMHDFCEIFSMRDMIKKPVKYLSFSQIKALELIRAVIQLPYLVILDDYDSYFDDKMRIKAVEILDYALSNGSAILATSRKRLEEFNSCFKIQERELVKL